MTLFKFKDMYGRELMKCSDMAYLNYSEGLDQSAQSGFHKQYMYILPKNFRHFDSIPYLLYNLN